MNTTNIIKNEILNQIIKIINKDNDILLSFSINNIMSNDINFINHAI